MMAWRLSYDLWFFAMRLVEFLFSSAGNFRSYIITTLASWVLEDKYKPNMV